ncbi:winged-helix domain-containing protein [Streptomyces sp. NPDC048172]|uniref:winged helix-turn-helix transcriptional regulator n=1 Tax=Streptomyces sp. NPDC048172 TaxID=3365505 RepID=UPI003720EA64
MTPTAMPYPVRRTRTTPRASLPALPTLLIAEADEGIAQEVTADLAARGVEVLGCRDGAEVLLLAGLYQPSMVLLGAPLPRVDATTVTALLGKHVPSPVVVGTGQQHPDEAVAALAAGALALVARPYRVTELLPLLQPYGADDTPSLAVGDIELDLVGLHTYVQGQPLRLPLREFQLLHYLMRHPNQVVSRHQILRELWGTDVTDTNTLTVHIKRLRTKLASVPGSCCTIDTIRGVGYRLECPVEARGRARSGR